MINILVFFVSIDADHTSDLLYIKPGTEVYAR